MTNKPNIHADWRINFFIHGIFKFGFFHITKKGFSFRHSHTFLCFCSSLFFLSYYSLIFTQSSIDKSNMTLCNLEEILIWLIWTEFHIEIECLILFNSLLFRTNSKWIFYPLLSGFIKNIQQGPINFNGEVKFIFDSHLFAFSESTSLTEGEIHEITSKYNGFFVIGHVCEHFFMKYNLTWIINWNFLIHFHIIER